LHQHSFTGADIGNRVGKNVWPLLFHQRGFLAVAFRFFVHRARLLPLLDVGNDNAIADNHLEGVDAPPCGSG
jgi:hypothetical protein